MTAAEGGSRRRTCRCREDRARRRIGFPSRGGAGGERSRRPQGRWVCGGARTCERGALRCARIRAARSPSARCRSGPCGRSSKGPSRNRCLLGSSEPHGQHVSLVAQIAVGAGQYAVVVPVLSGEQPGSRRAAQGCGEEGVLKGGSLAREQPGHRRHVLGTHLRQRLVVRHHEDDVRGGRPAPRAGPTGVRRRQQQGHCKDDDRPRSRDAWPRRVGCRGDASTIAEDVRPAKPS